MRHIFVLQNKTGNVLVGLVVTILIFSALGVGMLSLSSSSSTSQVVANNTARAYYIAESGLIHITWIRHLLDFVDKIHFIYISMLLVTLLTVYTAVQYFIVNRHHLKKIIIDLFDIFKSKRST